MLIQRGLLVVLILGALAPLGEGQRQQGRTSEGQACMRGDGQRGVCRPLTKCLKTGGTLEPAGSVELCSFSTYGNAIVCCRASARNIAKKKCGEWESGGATGLLATDVSISHIIGGEEAKAGEFPHMVSLLLKEFNGLRHICGGSLISAQYVLTAAHCVSNGGNELEVRVGAHDLSNPAEQGSSKFTVLAVHIPEDYKYPARYHDIALLRLSSAIGITHQVRPVCLPFARTQLQQGETLAVAGWGYQDGGVISDKLKKASLGYDDQVRCNQLWNAPGVRQNVGHVHPTGITNTIICASRVGADTCQGDSGGPLMHGPQIRHVPTLVGIVSQGFGCNNPVPGTYTRVESYLDWIVDIVWPDEV